MPEQQTITDHEPRRQRRRRAPQPLPPRDYLTRHELLAMVPLSMSTVDDLEKRGIFPSRFKLEPTVKVAWKRREVLQFMEARAKRRVHGPVADSNPSDSGRE
jgi:predicted DNA-binding transcriptional regulator AlpA